MLSARLNRGVATHLAGAMFGAGIASLASAAVPGPPPSFGPASLVVFGVEVPIFSAVFGLIGVCLARRVAPASAAGAKLGRTGNLALTVLLAMGVLALVVAGEKRPIVALGWSIGLGFSGLGFIELVARSVIWAVRHSIDAWAAGWINIKKGEK